MDCPIWLNIVQFSSIGLLFIIKPGSVYMYTDTGLPELEIQFVGIKKFTEGKKKKKKNHLNCKRKIVVLPNYKKKKKKKKRPCSQITKKDPPPKLQKEIRSSWPYLSLSDTAISVECWGGGSFILAYQGGGSVYRGLVVFCTDSLGTSRPFTTHKCKWISPKINITLKTLWKVCNTL